MINVSVTGTERIKAAFAQLDDAVQNKIIRQTANDVKDYVEQQADTHTKTGALSRSVYIKRISDGYEIGHDERMAPYAKFVHWGTKPHVIKPKNKKALKFVGKNGMVYMAWGNKSPQERAIILAWMKKKAPGARAIFRDINHPGYIGHPWLKDAIERVAKPSFEKNLSKFVSVL